MFLVETLIWIEVIADTEGAIEVLTGGPLSLYPKVVRLLEKALKLEQKARTKNHKAQRNALLRTAASPEEKTSERTMVE